MIIRITCENPRGSIQLNYDDSHEVPLDITGYGEPPIETNTLHTALDILVARAILNPLEKKTEVKND